MNKYNLHILGESVGTTKVTVRIPETEHYLADSATMTVTIEKGNCSITPPTINTSTLRFTNTNQALTSGGSVYGGTLYVGTSSSSSTAPTEWVEGGTIRKKDVGTYHIWYKVIGDATHKDIAPTYLGSKAIEKANATISLSTTSVSLNKTTTSTTVTVTTNSSGTVYANSSDTSIATTSVSGNVVTINSKNNGGTVQVTIGVNGNGSYNASETQTVTVVCDFLSTTLNNNSWEMISSIAKEGKGSSYWSVGDTKWITLNGRVGDNITFNNETVGVYILGFNHDEWSVGQGIMFGTFKATDGTDICLSDSGTSYPSYTNGTKAFNMNHWGNYNYGGWKGSDLRYDILGSTNIAPSGYGSAKTEDTVGYDATSTAATSPVPNTLMAALPSDLRAVMRLTKTYSNRFGGGDDTMDGYGDTNDFLWLPSEYEIYGAMTNSTSYSANTQSQYRYYKDGNSKVKYTHSSHGTARVYWTRCAYKNNETEFCTVNTDGSTSHISASSVRGLAPVFRV